MATISSKGKNTNNNYIAFFDLDHTIIRINSGKALICYAYNKGLLGKLDLIKGICLFLGHKLNLIESVKIINSMVRWVKGVSEARLNDLSSEIFNDQLLNSIYREVISEINFHKTNGAEVVILSSAIYPVCKRVAEHLEMDDVICSRLEVINGLYTGYPDNSFCFGKEKVNRLIEYCNKKNINPYESWYYGDSIADLPVLNIVSNPVCINPDRKLKKVALKHSWTILAWE